ncbi:hypothetical protein SRABI106_04174 [Rahnella aquatilis]|nr:hypothetical protein SRABI106_04174 [Rahnella aquatilis]
MIGFSGGEHQFVDARIKQTAEQRAFTVMETLHQLRQRQAHIVERLRSAVERLQAINQHNLAVKFHKVIFVKTFHDVLAVIVETRTQHTQIAVFICLRQLRIGIAVQLRQREKLQRRRTGHISRQNKAPRLDKVQTFGLAAHQIIGVGL